MNVSVINYTENLKGTVEITTVGNGTKVVELHIKYSDLYLYGETYSGVVNITSANDNMSIPVIINCADNLIYTNIPNNTISDTSKNVSIKFTSKPEVYKVVLKTDGFSSTDISDQLTIGDGYSTITITSGWLKGHDYIIASSPLNQVSIEIGGTSLEVGDVYEFERASGSPLQMSLNGGQTAIKFKSTKNGLPFYDRKNFELILSNGLELVEWVGNGEVSFKVDSYSGSEDKEYSIFIKHLITGESIKWNIVQLVPKDDNDEPGGDEPVEGFVFERVTSNPIYLDYNAQTFSLTVKSLKDGVEHPYVSIADDTDQVTFVGRPIHSGNGILTWNLEITENNTLNDRTFTVTWRQYIDRNTDVVVNTIYFDIIQRGNPNAGVVNEYVFERISPTPVYVDYMGGIVYVEVDSKYGNTKIQPRMYSIGTNDGFDTFEWDIMPIDGHFAVKFIIPETYYGNYIDFTLVQPYTDGTVDGDSLKLDYTILQNANPESMSPPDEPFLHYHIKASYFTNNLYTSWDGAQIGFVQQNGHDVETYNSFTEDTASTGYVENARDFNRIGGDFTIHFGYGAYDQEPITFWMDGITFYKSGMVELKEANNMVFYEGNDRDDLPLLGLFRDCKYLATICPIDTSRMADARYMFYGCNQLATIPLLDFSNVGWNATYVENTAANAFIGCYNLTTVNGFKNVKSDLTFEDCNKLTLGSLSNIINYLAVAEVEEDPGFNQRQPGILYRNPRLYLPAKFNPAVNDYTEDLINLAISKNWDVYFVTK